MDFVPRKKKTQFKKIVCQIIEYTLVIYNLFVLVSPTTSQHLHSVLALWFNPQVLISAGLRPKNSVDGEYGIFKISNVGATGYEQGLLLEWAEILESMFQRNG